MARGIIKTLGLAGAALTAWYFLDPKKGSDRRDNFMKSAKDLYNTAGDEFGRIGKDISGGLSETLTKVSEMTGMGAGNGKESEASAQTPDMQNAASQSETASAPISV